MVAINYANREVSCKIVYYGPGLSGKTTNLQYIHGKVPNTTRGDLISLATDADRTLYFDFLPINIGSINGFTTRFQLYTVPGQVFYNATRKLVLRGVDGLIFVADSQRDKSDENVESFNNLKENLAEYGYDLNSIPIILQYNKRDLPDVMSIDELNNLLNEKNWPVFESVAHKGTGVFDTLKLIIKMILEKARKSGTAKKIEEGSTAQKTPVSTAAPDAPAAIPPVKPVQTSEPQTDKIPIPSAAPAQTPESAPATEMSPAAQATEDPQSGTAQSPHTEPEMPPERTSENASEASEAAQKPATMEQGHSSAAAVAEPERQRQEDSDMTSVPTNQDVETGPDEGFEENTMAESPTPNGVEPAEEEVQEENYSDSKGRYSAVKENYSNTREYVIDDTQIDKSEPAREQKIEEREIQNEEKSEDPETEEMADPFALPAVRPKMAAPMRAKAKSRNYKEQIKKKKKKGFFLFRMFGKK